MTTTRNRPATWPPSPTAALRVEVDGKTVPIDECNWAIYRPCGCLRGVLMAEGFPTEEGAWKQFFDKKKAREQARKQGVKIELVTHERWKAELSAKFGSNCAVCREPTEQALEFGP